MQRRLHETPDLVQRLRATGEMLEIAPTHIIALLIVASCACAGLVVLWWTARPAHAPANRPVGLVATPPATSGAPSAPAPDRVVVHVSGAVASPGVRTLPGDARVDDAVRAAGGATRAARTDQLNLARPLRDGEQIHVPNASEVAAGAVAAGGGGASDGGVGGGVAGGQTGLINLNQATAAELDELPDIGPVLAERIIAFREANGGFRSVSDLQQVSGIGEKTFAGLEDLVTV
jgi:competence protein ComEA